MVPDFCPAQIKTDAWAVAMLATRSIVSRALRNIDDLTKPLGGEETRIVSAVMPGALVGYMEVAASNETSWANIT